MFEGMADRWRPGDPLPAWWSGPTGCPDGHPWGPRHVTVVYSKTGTYSHYCVPDPNDTRVHCRWRWHEQPDGEPAWQDYRPDLGG